MYFFGTSVLQKVIIVKNSYIKQNLFLLPELVLGFIRCDTRHNMTPPQRGDVQGGEGGGRDGCEKKREIRSNTSVAHGRDRGGRHKKYAPQKNKKYARCVLAIIRTP